MRHEYKDVVLEERIKDLFNKVKNDPSKMRHYKRALRVYAAIRTKNNNNYVFKK